MGAHVRRCFHGLLACLLLAAFTLPDRVAFRPQGRAPAGAAAQARKVVKKKKGSRPAKAKATKLKPDKKKNEPGLPRCRSKATGGAPFTKPRLRESFSSR